MLWMVTSTPVAKQKTSWTTYVGAAFGIGFAVLMLVLGVILVYGYMMDHRGGR